MWKSFLANKSGTPVEVNTDTGEDTGLVVATRPHKTFSPLAAFASNPDYGIEMAQDGKYGGTALLLHDGIDNVAWLFSEPTGTKWIADSTDRPYADAASLKCDNPAVGDIVKITNQTPGAGDDIDMTGNYVAVTFYINVDKDWAVGDSFSLYAYAGTSLVGNSVNIEDYFDSGTYDIWHQVNIPLTDLGIESSNIDSFLIENVARAGGKSPKFYIDEWYLQESGEPIDFEIKPNTGKWFYIKSFQFTMVDAYSADNADSTMPMLSYDKFLGMASTTGFVRERYNNSTLPVSRKRMANLMDMLSVHCSILTNHISDGTNTLITITQELPEDMVIILKSENLDKIIFKLEDSFDDLLYFRIAVCGYEEKR